MTFGTHLRTRHEARWLMLAGVGLIATWEVAALLIAGQAVRPNSILPSIPHTLGAFSELSDYWPGGLGIKATQDGGRQTVVAGILALGYGALITGMRLVLGMALATALGVGGGLLIGYVPAIRRFAFSPLNLLGALPLIATLPLFAFWFGATTQGAVLFIGFGAGITLLRATLNAVENIPRRYINNARVLGASSWMVYRTIIVPGILPELRGGMAIALTFSWSMALAAELIGIQDGLGRMMLLALRFSEVDRMILIGAVFVALAATTVLVFDRLADRAIKWEE
ncbi:MAG: binding--dependent transport system inner rane component family protein [Solirubrobacterales bacterium]|nr:binding--dependent transport system inner rane component family protein [Solirubrobacterales bacterium]